MKGEFLRGFSYSKGCIKRIAAPTWAPAPSETEIQAAGSSVSVEGNTPISSDDCVIINWYSCTDMCYYMYTEYRNCSVDDGGWIDDGGGYPTGDDYGNGSLGPTPETGSSTSHIDNLIKVSTLSVDQYNLLKNAFNEMMQNCIGTSIYSALVNNSTKLNFNMNSQQTSVGRFDPRSLTITFKNNESIGWRALQEELFHSYQNIYYAGGIAQYSDYGSANIEFEAKLLQDILGLVEGQGSATAIAGHEYYYWLLNITNDGSKFPSNYSEIQNEYFHFLQQFPQQNSGYTSTTIRGGLLPNAMFNVISNSNCSK